MSRFALWAVGAALLAAPAPVRPTCVRTLSLPGVPSGASSYATGWCAPYAASSQADAHAACDGLAVPPGSVLQFGTCALPGASCVGETALALLEDGAAQPLVQVERVQLNSSVAVLAQGCVLGARCSYAEWRNVALATRSVSVQEGCAGVSPCAGVVAWRTGPAGPLSPAQSPPTTTALAFDVVALQQVTVTAVAGTLTGTGLVVQQRVGSAFASGALASSGSWSSLGSLTLSPGAVGSLLVTISSGALTCAHALGNQTATLIADGALQVLQGATVTSPLSVAAAPGAACAWDSLQVTYTDSNGVCSAPPPPPLPSIATSVPYTLVTTLDDLRRALRDPSILAIEVNNHIVLNGTELTIGRDVNNQRTLLLEGTTSCRSANPATPLCSISGAGLSRVLSVAEGVTLHLAHLLLRDGVAPAGQDGGCVEAPCATCSLTLETLRLTNCSAPTGRGGGLAATGGGSMLATDVVIDSCTATLGGGLLDDGGTLNLTRVTVSGCSATGGSQDSIALAGLSGPSGGGMTLHNVTGIIAYSTVVDNWATTTDVVLLSNPDFVQARGGGLLVASSAVNISTSVFSGNTAFYGGGVYLFNSSMWIDACVLRDNIATTGDGGGLFAADCPHVCATRSLVSSNAAGGHIGGGFAAMNTYFDILGSVFTDNAAPNGCGGGLGLDAGAFSTVAGDSVLANNSALSGGGLCCDWCESFTAQQTTLYNNVATTGSGGAVYLGSSPSTLQNVSMFGNQAPAGGAVSAVSTDLNMTGCSVLNNVAFSTHGGAVFHDARSHGTETLVLNNCTFDSNTCNAAGGGVAAFSSASVVATQCWFNNNSITATSPAGGAVMSLDVTSLVLQSCTFTWNWVEIAAALGDDAPLGYRDGVFAPGTGSGGAIWIGSDAPVTASVLGSRYSHNWAVTGGGMYLTGAIHFTMDSTYMEHCHAYGYSSEGGGIVTDVHAVSVISNSEFYSNEAVRGGHSWHGASSDTTYASCLFNENEGKPGDDTKGTAVYVGEEARVLVRDSTFLNNIGTGIAEGTICLGGSNVSHLSIQNTTFDGNTAHLGGCLMLTVPSQVLQLDLSSVTFRNNRAYVGSVVFTECAVYRDIRVTCSTCDLSLNNSAENYGHQVATPPEQFIVNMQTRVRSGAPLPINVTLKDGFDQTVMNWIDTIATIATTASMSGSLRTFYADGAAVFKELALRGNESVTYQLDFKIAGPDLFGNDINEKSLSANVSVQACELGESFNIVRMECACAAGYGLVVEDNTCRTCRSDEVVPLGSLSCATCPALSAPSVTNPHECVCFPGYFGTVVGATGVCTQCPADTFRGEADPPALCRDCPATSHTFSLGATSEKACLCAANHFNNRGGVNGTFECAPVPPGGWAPQADSRLFALENFWRPNANHTTFYECSMSNCRKELPMPENVTQLGYNCRDGHTGHLCAVCQEGFAYQGVHCSRCAPGSKFSEWSSAKRSGLIFIGLVLLGVALFLLFLLPLFPRVEAMLQTVLQPATQRVEAMLSNLAQTAAGDRPLSAAKRAAQLLDTSSPEARRLALAREARQSDEARLSASSANHRRSHIARLSAAIRLSQPTMRLASTRFTSVTGSEFGIRATWSMMMRTRNRLPPISRLRVFLDTVAEPIRTIISFWQVVSSFSGNLYVPWPSIYYALANTLNVASLQFLKLPAISCIQPEVSFFVVFNGVTITTFCYLVFVVVVYKAGQSTKVIKTDPQRRRRFKSRCLNLCIWGLFLVYPQVSSTTLSIFACTPLEDGTQWLSADLRIQCFDNKHLLYVVIGIIWTLLFPIGIPLAFTLLLRKAHIPELAAWKRDCAWLRNIAQRAIVLSIFTTADIDSDGVTTDTITLEQLRLLHRMFVLCEFGSEGEQPTGPFASLAPSAHGSDVSANGNLPALTDGRVGKASQPSATPSARSNTTSRRKPDTPPAPLPSNPVLAVFARLQRKVAHVTKLHSHTVRKTLSAYFYADERARLLTELLDWAKRDKTSLVAEPRSNALRWRTEHEWVQLQLDGVPLSSLDTAERAAFYRYSFLFSSYAVRSWYYETVDLGHKLFLTSIIAFIAPHTSVQVIVALIFAFAMVLYVTQVKPYREPANNQLVALAHINIFLFLFTGLLLQTNPDGITSNKMVFSVIVGTLTTSIVAFSFYLFVRELFRQILNALIAADVAEDAEDELAELEEELEAGENLDAAQRDSAVSDGALVPWESGHSNGNGNGPQPDGELAPDEGMPPQHDLAT